MSTARGCSLASLRGGSHGTPASARVRELRLGKGEPTVTHSYQAIDADGHILEPLDLWDKYIAPAYHDRRPRFVIDDNGKERLSVDGKLLGNPRGIGSLGSVGVRQGTGKLDR